MTDRKELLRRIFWTAGQIAFLPLLLGAALLILFSGISTLLFRGMLAACCTALALADLAILFLRK